jgi:hypothetical protein
LRQRREPLGGEDRAFGGHALGLRDLPPLLVEDRRAHVGDLVGNAADEGQDDRAVATVGAGAGPRRRGHRLVRVERVVGLVEGVDRDLPVAAHHHALPPADPQLLELEGRERLRHGGEVVEQRLDLGVHRDEHPAAPGLQPHGLQAERLLAEARAAGPVLLVRDVEHFAREAIAPAVELADQLPAGVAAGLVLQLAAAVLADVVERPHAVGVGADDEDRLVGDVEAHEVADARHLLLAAGQQPGARPQPLLLQHDVFARDVGVDRDEIGTHLGLAGDVDDRHEVPSTAAPVCTSTLGRDRQLRPEYTAPPARLYAFSVGDDDESAAAAGARSH